MEMPKNCKECPFYWEQCGVDPEAVEESYRTEDERHPDCPLIHVPPHGRLIDADALRQTMYHEAFETDSPMQKWDSGCWIRYKMFERMEEAAPTIIPAEPAKEGEE